MRFPRSCGTLVHPTSFPGKYGMGDFGREAREFIDFLAASAQTIWQVLPLGPVGGGYSPYAGSSAFAGNPYLISIDLLAEKGLLTKEETETAVLESANTADFETAFRNKDRLMRVAYGRFYERLAADSGIETEFRKFEQTNTFWLTDYALFEALSRKRGGTSWNAWEPGYARRRQSALQQAEASLKSEILYQKWLQFEFFAQWQALKGYANMKGIRVIGDIPIFVDYNSADVWAHAGLFKLDEAGNKLSSAGVPPDYFSKTGQLWGNPLYNWKKMQKDNFSWWTERFRHMFCMYDAVRIDHFRGFEAYWEVEAGAKTAETGRWVKGPGEQFFDVMRQNFKEFPVIAEDLGTITGEVEALRDKYQFPGMKVLQFAFNSNSSNAYLPHNYSQNSVVYTGTHDNNTTAGWYNAAPEEEKHKMRVYTRSDGTAASWELIRLAMYSVADQAIIPLQDFMGLDGSHRFNIPGTASGNWNWRYLPQQLALVDTGAIRFLADKTNR